MISRPADLVSGGFLKRYNIGVPSSRMETLQLLRLLTARLERLSVDSHWARRASGLRGNILKVLEQADAGETVAAERLALLTESAFSILRRAAGVIPDPEDLNRKKADKWIE